MKSVALLLSLLFSLANATNFSSMPTETLLQIRGEISEDERPAFQEEMRKRLLNMSSEEREALSKGLFPETKVVQKESKKEEKEN